MKRLFALGAAIVIVAGAVALYFAGDRDAPPSASSASAAPPIAADERPAAPSPVARASNLELELLNLITRTFGDAERARIEAIAQQASADELVSLARFVSTLPNLRGKPIALNALLSRYAMIDPVAAALLARELEVDPESIGAVQRDDLATEIANAERLPAEDRRKAFERLAANAVERDPVAAFAYGDRLGNQQARGEYTVAVYRAWARRDPEAMLRYVARLDSSSQQAALDAGGFEAFAQLEPSRMLELAERLSGDVAQRVRAMALAGIGTRDPHAAVLYVEMMPASEERTALLSLVARGYVAVDPQGALAWAESLQPPAPTVLASVLVEIARIDPDRVLDALLAVSPPQRMQQLATLISSGALSDERTADLADRWPQSARGRSELRWMTSVWARRAPKQALEWLLANPERAHGAAFAQAAANLGRVDIAAAEAYLDRVPSEHRALWIKSAADGYAQMDPSAAARWVARYADEPGYDAAVATVAQRTARTDPPAAARLLARVDANDAHEAVNAAAVIATRWVESDARAARGWALGLRAGDVRNAALTPLVAARAAETGEVDAALVSAFTADAAGQQALTAAILAVARSNHDTAQRLAAQYLVDPELRQRVERAGPRPR